jgi:imidazolonepropionase-like amidohydrolase
MCSARRFRWVVVLLAFVLVLLLPSAAQRRSQAVVIRGVTLIDGTGKPPQEKVNLVIERGQIQVIGRDAKAPEAAESIDATGKFVIPGLIDARVQIGPTPANSIFRGEITIEQRLQSLRALLAAGVTTVRLVQGDLDEQLLYQRWQKEALIVSPRIITSGPTFTAPGGRPAEEYSIMSQLVRNRETREVPNEDAARDEARELAHSGVQVFEIVYDAGSGGIPFPRLEREAFGTIIQEAHGHDRKVFCEVGRNEEAALAVSMGVDSIEGVWEEVLSDGNLADLAHKQISYVPSLTEQGDLVNLFGEQALNAYLENPIVQRTLSNVMKESLASKEGLLANMRKGFVNKPEVATQLQQQQARAYENVRRAHSQGVVMALGTGSGGTLVFPGAAVHRELQLLVKAGLSPMDAIVIATKNTAQSLGKGDELGTLEPGKRADLVILDGNPLADIKNTEKIDRVMQDGRLVKSKELEIH